MLLEEVRGAGLKAMVSFKTNNVPRYLSVYFYFDVEAREIVINNLAYAC